MRGGRDHQMLLNPDPQAVCDRLERMYPGLCQFGALRGLPLAHRSFVAEMAGDWRGADIAGHAALIAVRSDALPGTGAEHDDAVAIWCRRQKMAKGIVQTADFCAIGRFGDMWHGCRIWTAKRRCRTRATGRADAL